MSDIDLPPWILEKITRGEAILFLGAGASFGSLGKNGEKPLNGNQLRDALSDKFLGGKRKDKPLADVSEHAKYESSLSDVQRYVSELFEPLYPDIFHKIIPTFRWRAIFTTNYDFVVERAYQDQSHRLQTLGPIVRDTDNFTDVVSSLDRVPFLKIHGCLSVINDPHLPLILAKEEYAKHKNNRARLFMHLEEWGKEHVIIFCGYDLSDPNVQQIVYGLGDASDSRSPYVMVRPYMDEFDMRYWSARRVIPIDAKFDKFLEYLDASVPKVKRNLGALINDGTTIEKHLAHGTPSEILRAYLNQELDHVHGNIASTGSEPKDFFHGLDTNWEAIRQNLDIRRRITDEILIEAVLDAPDESTPTLHLVKGYAGSGKTVTLRRVAWNSATEHSQLVFWLNRGGVLRVDLIEEICALTDDRVFLFIEDGALHFGEIEAVVRTAKRKNLKLSIFIGVRTNEWNVLGTSLESSLDSEYELRDLSDKEITDLINKLESVKCLGTLEEIAVEDRKSHFVLTTDRQLLVALHEATSGKPFEEIVMDEYRNVVPSDAQLLYLDVCTLHRFGVGVRAGLISRISGINFTFFQEKLLKPLEHVISIYHDSYSKDFAYRTRHTLVADIVFRKIFDDPEERASQIVRVVTSMNTDYKSDNQAFSELVRGRELAELFSDRVLADRIFEAAINSGADKGHVEHQRAVFELNHPGGSNARAERALKAAEKSSSQFSTDSILHTRATLLRRQAGESTNELISKKHLDDAEDILIKLVRKGKTAHSFHALGQLYREQLRNLDSGSTEVDENDSRKERAFSVLVGKLEKVLNNGLEKFPGDSYLKSLEAAFATDLNDSSRALAALTKANEANEHDQHIAIRLSRMYKKNGNESKAITILSKCVEINPAARRAKLQLAKYLIAQNNPDKNIEIRKLLRSGFSDGDTNYETQFWFARHEFLFGDREYAKTCFKTLSRSKSKKNASKKLGILYESSGDAKRFSGSIKSIRDNYCFARVHELNEDIFIHLTECDDDVWKDLRLGDTVTLSVCFNFKGPEGFSMESGFHS